MQGHLAPWDLYLNKISKEPLGNVILHFKHPSQEVLKKKDFEYFSMYFYGLNLGPLARSQLGPWDHHFNKFGKGPPGNATYQISSS